MSRLHTGDATSGCEEKELGPGIALITCRRGGRRLPCQVPGCTNPHVALCDFPLAGPKAGRTCDRRMCEAHRTRVGRDQDHCAVHAALAAKESPTRANEAMAAALSGKAEA